jgi:GH25 family lysozyme M1 (1,4-beta-N-acetylmuramidase)
MISIDNYTKTPTIEVIGVYDLNTLGSYKLTFKITDESGNFNTKDFTLNVVSKVIPKKIPNTKTIYEDIVTTHKNDNTKIGLDISKWQGDVDYDKLKEKNVEFVMFRIGYQKGYDKEFILDEKFERNIRESNRVGIPVGLYFYSYANSKKDAEEQALWIIDKIKNYSISLPIAFDFEDWSNFSKQNMSIKDINDIATHFMKTLEDNGYDGINYSSKYYLENIWNIDEYPVWLAHYSSKTDYAGEYSMWQLCQDGRIDGINGAVDINVMYKNLIKNKNM